MHVKLVTLTGIKFDKVASEVRVQTTNGAMVILPNHEPLTAQTVPSPITIIDTDNNDEVFASYGGLIEVTGDQVRILLDEVDYATDIVETEVQAALQVAIALKSKARDQTELDEAQRLIDRQAVRLEVSQIRRRRPRS